KGHGGGPVGRPVVRLRRPQRLAQLGTVGAGRSEHGGGAPSKDERHAVVAAQVVNPACHFLARGFEAAGRDIGGLHGGGGIEDDDDAAADDGRGGQERPGQGQHQGQQNKKLQEEQQ